MYHWQGGPPRGRSGTVTHCNDRELLTQIGTKTLISAVKILCQKCMKWNLEVSLPGLECINNTDLLL